MTTPYLSESLSRKTLIEGVRWKAMNLGSVALALSMLVFTCVGLSSCIGVTPYRKPRQPPISAEQIKNEYGIDATVGEQHRSLLSIVGAWKGEFRRRLAASIEFAASPVNASAETLYGGRFVRFSYRTMDEEGELLFGYETTNSNYVLVVIDSTSTQVRVLRGAYLPESQTFELYGGYQVPGKGDRVDQKAIIMRSESRLDIELVEEDRIEKIPFKSLEFRLELDESALRLR